MKVHKLTAGDGYSYLTRQVAAVDATDKGHTALGDYYAQKGGSPGVWLGSGLAGLEGMEAGQPVSAEQMKALFGEGRQLNSSTIEQAAIAAGRSACGDRHNPRHLTAGIELGSVTVWRAVSLNSSDGSRTSLSRRVGLRDSAGR